MLDGRGGGGNGRGGFGGGGGGGGGYVVHGGFGGGGGGGDGSVAYMAEGNSYVGYGAPIADSSRGGGVTARTMHKDGGGGDAPTMLKGPPSVFIHQSKWTPPMWDDYLYAKMKCMQDPKLEACIASLMKIKQGPVLKQCGINKYHPSLDESRELGCLFCGPSLKKAVVEAAHAPAGGHAGIDHKAEAAVDALVGDVKKAHLG